MASSTDTFYTFFLCVYQNAYVEAKIFVFIDFFSEIFYLGGLLMMKIIIF